METKQVIDATESVEIVKTHITTKVSVDSPIRFIKVSTT